MDTKFSDKELSNIFVDKIEFIDISLLNNLLKDITNIDTINIIKFFTTDSFAGKEIQIFLDFTDIKNTHFCIIGSNLLEIKTKIILEYNKNKSRVDKKQFYWFADELNRFQDCLKYVEGLTFNDYLEFHNAFRQIEEMILCKIEKDENNE